jgi:hypothetical protein
MLRNLTVMIGNTLIYKETGQITGLVGGLGLGSQFGS